jgi:hypothetical protein
MKKVIKLTEAELTNLIKKVIQEQSTEKMIKPASVSAPKSMTDKLGGATTASAELWGKSFPCLAKEAKVGPTYATADGKTLLYQWNTDSDNEYIARMANEGNFGQVKGGGKYWCSSEDKNKLMIIVPAK